MVEQRVSEWRKKFSKLQGGKEIVSLTGDTSADLQLLEKGDVIVCTPSQVCNRDFPFLVKRLDSNPVGCHFKTMAPAEKCSTHRVTYC
jgi:hypothetical protein